MAEGVKHDGGKLRYELIPPELLEGIAWVLTHGAKKYGDRNWELGIKYSRIFGALMRHMWAWWGGEDLDKESGKSHLWHAGCELAFLIAFETRERTDLDDRVLEAGNDVLQKHSQEAAQGLAHREDEQSVQAGDSGRVVQRPEGGLVGGVQVRGSAGERVYYRAGGAIPPAAGVDRGSVRRG